MERPDPKFFIGEPVLIASKDADRSEARALDGTRTTVLEREYFQQYRLWGYRVAALRGIFWAEVYLRPLPGREPGQWDTAIFQPREMGVPA